MIVFGVDYGLLKEPNLIFIVSIFINNLNDDIITKTACNGLYPFEIY